MTRGITALVGAALIAIGCNQSSPPGGPGANKQQPAVGQGDNTFKLNAPVTETSIKQGESKEATISISRGKNFSEDVKVDFSEMPKGLTIMPATPTIKASDKDAKLTIEATKDAALGHHVITVWGTPTHGEKTSVNLKVEVKAAS